LEGAAEVQLQYPTSSDYENTADCSVGGLPRNVRKVTGCLIESGAIFFDETQETFNYTYTTIQDNRNYRTLKLFSAEAETRMRPFGNELEPYYDSFQPFVDFYGRADYADHMIEAAFDKVDTELLNGNLPMLSADYSPRARLQIIKKGTAHVTMSMYVLRELEDAVADCLADCEIGACNDDPDVFSIDEAVAYWAGTEDLFMNSLADKRCVDFATCTSPDGPTRGTSAVNEKVFRYFDEMQSLLTERRCDEAKLVIPKIASQMWIPLIQGTLRYAWALDQNSNIAAIATDVGQSEGAIFMAAVLPMINQCDSIQASIIYENMQVNPRVEPDFVAVKSAFEACYEHLGITCSEVGGIASTNGREYANCLTMPCGSEYVLAPPELGCGVPGVEIGPTAGATPTFGGQVTTDTTSGSGLRHWGVSTILVVFSSLSVMMF